MSGLGAVKVSGYSELIRSFRKISKSISKELRAELRKTAEPVKVTAQQLALGDIRNMPRSPRWAGMRIGVTAKGVYLVPASRRGRGSGRANLKGLLLEQAMDPAVERESPAIMDGVGQMFDNLTRASGF